MSLIVSSIVGGVNEQNSTVNTLCVDDWSAELLTIATLLAFIALSAAQSSAQTHIHSAIVVIDTSNNA